MAFKKADLAGKRADIQAWAKDEILPIIAHYTSNVDAKFEGVINVGKMLKDKDVLNKSIEELTDKNPDYWRATMEMNLGNQLIPFTKVALLMAKGEFDRARNLLNIIGFFYDKKSLPSVYHRALQGKLQAMYNELSKLVNEGIKLHDAQKYKEAVKHYNEVAEQFPNSAWLNYEIYFSTAFPMKDKKNKEDQDKVWQKWKKIIYTNDPMYHMDVRANSGKEGYLLYQRQRTNDLFRENEKFKSDFVAYADIALDLENYALAAQAYWLILSSLPKESYKNRNILAHYLYCLDKLGNKETIKIFKGDFKKEFKKIKEERISLMKKSTIYNSFKNKD